MKAYNPILKKSDPFVNLKLPKNILADLALRAIENGTNLNLEISIRLARTLERDIAMIEEDNHIAFLAFEMQQHLRENQGNGGGHAG